MYPKTLTDFYQYAVHLVYAVIIGQSFSLASIIFVPIDNILNFDGFQRGFALFLAYVIIITGWVGWSKSITRNPHSENALGNFRFVTDLFILFLFYYLINLTGSDKTSSYRETFLWVLPVIFFSYIIWDLLKYYEYRCEDPEELGHRKRRFRDTIFFTLPFIAQAIIYNYVIHQQPFLKWGENNAWNIVFMCSTFALIIAYRWRKWVVPTARKRRGARKKNTNPSPTE
jgi:Na+/melibiose symporter-like transporter